MSQPAVSVIVPCFNLGEFVAEAVDSVLAQSLQDFEIIVVDDGSSDSVTVQRLVALERPRTQVVTTTHQGLARARNHGVSLATGRYLCALDADDRLAPTFLEQAVRVLDREPDVAFVSCWLDTFGDESWVWRQERCDLPGLLAECTVCTAALVRRSAVLAVGGYDEHMPDQGYEDWDLWISLVERGYTGTILPEVLFHYRRRAGSMSTVCNSGEPHLRLMRYLYEKHASSYAQHLSAVLAHKHRQTGELLRGNHAAERHQTTWLLPEVERRREELARLQQKLATAQANRRAGDERAAMAAQIAELTTALEWSRHEVGELRNSKSWRVTAPLRRLYGWVRRP